MVHYQHEGPIGQYHVPKEPRFRFDEERRRAVSLVPNIDVVDESINAWGSTSVRTLLRIDKKFYTFRANSEEKYDENGEQVFKYVGEKKNVSDHVWGSVESSNFHNQDYDECNLENFVFSSIDDPITNIILEYLAINKRAYLYQRVSRIIFAAEEPITPKVWEVVCDDNSLPEANYREIA